MMKLDLLNQIEFIGNWGYYQLTQFHIRCNDARATFHTSFAELKSSDFFLKSKGFIQGSEMRTDIHSNLSSSFGKHYFDSLSSADYKEMDYEGFMGRLDESIKNQKNNFSLLRPFFHGRVFELESEIIPISIKIIDRNASYFILERSSDDIGGIGASIWDYFKNFVVFNVKDQVVFRIDMGRD
ncbi:MAG: hypothetical protein QM763_00835 [Agriterribacter sp.]